MSSLFAATGGPGDGLFFAGYTCQATNRSGAATGAGEVVMFDLAQSATEVDNGTPGSSDSDGNNSGYNNYIDPAITSPAVKHYIYGIALEAIADNATGPVLVKGRVVAAVAAATVAGTALVANADGEMDVTAGTADAKVIAIAEEADVSNLASVLFDGVHGFGADVAT